jgi:hypothetical protein
MTPGGVISLGIARQNVELYTIYYVEVFMGKRGLYVSPCFNLAA